MAHATGQLKVLFYLLLINLSLNSHMWLPAAALDRAGLDYRGLQPLLAPSSPSLHSSHSSPLSFPKTRTLTPAPESLHLWSPHSRMFFPSLLRNFFILLTTTFLSLLKIVLYTYVLICLSLSFLSSPPHTKRAQPAGVQAPFEQGS